MMHRKIRLAIVGDEGVGKTSLVCTIISDMPNDLPHIHKKVVLPPDMCPYSKDVFTQIVDTSSDAINEIKLCDLVVLVYEVGNDDSILRLNEHWMPTIAKTCQERGEIIPVVIVGNKLDKLHLPVDQENVYVPVKEVLKGLSKTYKQVQMGIQCSATYDKNIKKVLNSAQRAVLYPLSPLYDVPYKRVTPKFRKALLRIFRILDSQLSGSLTDRDLSGLQERVFRTQLSVEDIRAIKNIVQRECEQEQGNSISVNGFVAFQRKCIEMQKIQICWNILKHFDYNGELDIKDSGDSFAIKFQDGEGLQLTQDALNFLQNIYVYSLKSSAQGQNPMQKLFEPAPEIPLPQFKQNNISLQRFIYLWHLFTILDYRSCYRALLYIGYDCRLEQCFNSTPNKKKYSNIENIKDRSAYNVLLVGCGEYQSLIQAIMDRGVEEEDVVRNVTVFSGQKVSKVINLFAVKQKNVRQVMMYSQLSKKIDLVISFEGESLSQRELRQMLPEHVMRKELRKEQADKLATPTLNLKDVPITIKEHPKDKLLNYIVFLFNNIDQAFPHQYIQTLKSQASWTKKAIVATSSVLAVLALAVIAYKNQSKPL